MARLVDACEAEVTILPHLAILGAVDHHALVACGAELLAVGVFDRETDSLAAEPVAWTKSVHFCSHRDAGLTNVISITVRQTDAHILVEQVLEIQPEVGVDEVARVLERVVDAVGAGVV